MWLDRLIAERVLETPIIIEAFRAVHREDFLPDHLRPDAEIDAPLPIGLGQTCSQPYTVAFMLELLQPKPGQKILDIGSGSGWTSALLAYIVRGKVYAVEIVPELCALGQENIGKYNFIEKGIVEYFCKDGSRGLADKAPFDRILVSAAAEELPRVLLEQLAAGGKLVIPIRSSVWLYEKLPDGSFREEEHSGFAFVPLVR